MKTKLQRAVDATLEKYDGLLWCALCGEEKAYLQIDVGPCAFCHEFKNHSHWFSVCNACPVKKDESGDRDDYACVEPVIRPLAQCGREDGSIPAILAAMIYLWGFVEDDNA